MSICSGIGNGIGGALGKFGAGLGSALGLGAVVDAGVRAYTGYGLLETLSVPYIECPDGSFASAMEWYGSGLKCPSKKENIKSQEPTRSQKKAAKNYNELIKQLGGVTYTYWGAHAIGLWTGSMSTVIAEVMGGHWKPQPQKIDAYGNVLNTGLVAEGLGDSQVRSSFLDGNIAVINYGWGGWGSSSYANGVDTDSAFSPPFAQYLEDTVWQKHIGYQNIIGIRASIPITAPKAPPTGNIPPPRGFSPPDRKNNKEDCEEVSCACVTPADIEKAVKKALGLTPFAPEKLIRELGAKMFAAPGPSLIPVVPQNLVEAIAALVAANYMRAGYGRYPVMMPQSLINDDSIGDAVPAQPLENFAEWFEWHIKQQDAVQGEWPIDIAIVDGAKRQPLKFENMSEAFAELTGLVIQTAADADAAVSVASHAAVAATKSQTAAVIAQKNVECLIKFFGVRTGYGSIFVDSVITPMDSDSPNFNLKKFLTPSKQSVAFLTDVDPFDFQAVCDRILRNSEIAKAAVAMDASKELVGDYARNQRKYDAAEAKKEAEKELDKLQSSINTQNPDFKIKIKVDTPAGNADVPGNNFVIKRPKSE
ncbi:hypothetical protein Q5692_35680 [Microcoleus sp. C2C3]|uniref:hypothetical protein n=1 Tax=unclassified Microcoleus TaxID=2642155 RepID=UPI002FD3435B